MKPKYRFLFASVITAALASGVAHAVTGTWSGATNGTWDTSATNWTITGGGTNPWDSTNGGTNNAIFNTASLNNVVSGTVYTNGITFSTAGVVGGSGTITLAGTNPFINVTSTDFAAGRIYAVLAGTSGFNKTGAGEIALVNANTLSGDITISAGGIRVGLNTTAGDLGSVANVYLGSNGTAVKFHRSNAYTWNGNISSTDGDRGDVFNEGGGDITLGGNLGTSTGYISKFTNFGTGQLSISGTNYLGISTQAIGVVRSAWNITGGQTTTKAGTLFLGDGVDRAGQLNLSGSGQLIVVGNTVLRIGASAGSRNGASSLNISDTALFDTGTTTGLFQLGSSFASAEATDSGTINLNGGTLSTNRVITGGTIGDSTFNFNGGVFKANGTAATISGMTTAEIKSGGAFINSNGFDIAMSQVLSGSGALTKQGAGTLTLSAANTYSGATTLNQGTLALSGTGSLSGTSAITINSSTTLSVTGLTGDFTLGASQSLGGSGTLLATGKNVIANGTLSPGNSPGTLIQDGGNLQLGANGDLNWQVYDVGGAAGTGYDTVSLINGATLDLSLLSEANPYNINLWSLSGIGPDVNGDAINFNNTLNYSWTLFSTGSTISGFNADLFAINVGAFNGTSGFSNTLNGTFGVALGDSNTDLILTYTAIPEPGAAFLGGIGFLLLLRRRRIS